MLSDSGDASQASPSGACDVLPSTNQKVSATPIYKISELNHFGLAVYGSPLSLSTLNPFRYLHRPKTRSGMRWAPLSRGDFHPDMVNASWRTRFAYRQKQGFLDNKTKANQKRRLIHHLICSQLFHF